MLQPANLPLLGVISAPSNPHLDVADMSVSSHLPPFPDDVPTAPLVRVSLQRLIDRDVDEEERFWKACCDLGFFYLDLQAGSAIANPDTIGRRDSGQGVTFDAADGVVDGPGLLEDAEALFDLGEAVFALSDEEKSRYDFKDQGSYFGYKGFGQGIIDGAGHHDRNEFYNISKDDILAVNPEDEPLSAPKVLQDKQNRARLKSYMQKSHAIVTLLLSRLNDRLDLPPETLPSLHRLRGISGDQVRWVRSPPRGNVDEGELSMGEHTDFGSVSILFNRLGGLQILPPMGTCQDKDECEWRYVKPLPGHCVVNLGDALVKFTAGILRSNLHRVINPPGAQAEFTRMSLVYFARPEDPVLLKTLEGSDMIDRKRRTKVEFVGAEAMTAKEWILRRALGRRAGGDFASSMGTEGS